MNKINLHKILNDILYISLIVLILSLIGKAEIEQIIGSSQTCRKEKLIENKELENNRQDIRSLIEFIKY